MKSRGVYETPGGTILHAAHRALESITMDRELLHLRDSLVPRYAEMIYYGFWYAPEREALQVLMDHAQRDVTGTVRLKLYKGNVTVAGRRSPRSLYRQDVVTFEADSVYRQKDAEGFIRLNALRLRIRALRDQDRAAARLVIDVALTLEEVRGIPLAGVTAVVLDVVRASTTIVAALAGGASGGRSGRHAGRGAGAAAVARGADPVLDRRRAGRGPPPGFDHGNSPAEYTPDRVRGRTVVFTTTNGTRALLALGGARAGSRSADSSTPRPWSAGRRRSRATSSWSAPGSGAASAWRTRSAPGCWSRGSRPDGGGLTDAARAARALWERYANDLGGMLADAAWAQALVGQGRGSDLPLCVALDVHGVVPVLRDGALVASAR